MSSTGEGGSLQNWYRNRIGYAETADEIWGYWLFVLGIVLGVVGIGLLVISGFEGPVPQWPVVLAAVGLVLIVAGPIIRLPLRAWATRLVYLGAILSVLAVPWFVLSYPGWRSQAVGIVGLYGLGLLVMAIGGIFVPLLTAGAERKAERSRQADDIDRLTAERDETVEDRDRLAGDLEGTEARVAELSAQHKALESSQARFELYQDASSEWRWRLRHRNGNNIADSGEGYTRKHNAQKGIQSVRRNALGATMLQLERAELPEPDEMFEPVAEMESRATFERYTDNAGEYRWRLRHDNGNLLADGGEGYSSTTNADRAIERVKSLVGPAAYLRIDPVAFEIYRDSADEFRWRLIHRNGNILADSGEGYTRSNDARRAASRLRDRMDDLDIEVYEDNAGEFRWRLSGRNDEIVADSGEGYDDRGDAEDAAERLKERAESANILEIGKASFEVYEDAADEWRWRLRARNGNIMADSGEGYTERNDTHEAIESVKRNGPNAEVEVST